MSVWFNARLFIRARTNSQAIRTGPYGDSDRLFVRVRLHNRGCHYSMSKPNLTFPVRKPTAMVPLIEYGLDYWYQNKVQPDHFNHNNLNPNSNAKTDPNPKSKNNICSTKLVQHLNKVQCSVKC